ncbi:hypothetical protein D3C78_894090 [compost metagenome]
MHGKYSLFFVGYLYNIQEVPAANRNRFFTNYMFSSLQGLDGDLFMSIIRRGNQYHIYSLIVQNGI